MQINKPRFDEPVSDFVQLFQPVVALAVEMDCAAQQCIIAFCADGDIGNVKAEACEKISNSHILTLLQKMYIL